jgi:cytochrome c peroxidase
MRSQNFTKCLTVIALTSFFTVGLAASALASLSNLEQLGKNLFHDANLSTPPGMSCASCHAPEAGWTGPQSSINAAGAVMPGVVHTRAGNRKPPSAAYAGDSPVMFFDKAKGLFLGGMFWDGRATGWTLGDPLQEQALGPFLNLVEMNNPKAQLVIIKIIFQSPYADLFLQEYSKAYSVSIAGLTPKTVDVQKFYQFVGKAIAAYERSAEVNPFSSKYDYFLNSQATLTPQEANGLKLFNGTGKCAACHPSGPNALFTDFSYDNLGVPKNPLNPFYFQTKKINPDGENWVDPGLGGFLATTAGTPDDYSGYAVVNMGKHKVPTLRNVDKRPYDGFVKAYGHNGYFKSLEEIVHFYNTRAVSGEGWNGQPWPAPEVAAYVNVDELGNLGLTAEEEAAIVAFLKTLSDGYQPQ